LHLVHHQNVFKRVGLAADHDTGRVGDVVEKVGSCRFLDSMMVNVRNVEGSGVYSLMVDRPSLCC
jgi:hypothetical protein